MPLASHSKILSDFLSLKKSQSLVDGSRNLTWFLKKSSLLSKHTWVTKIGTSTLHWNLNKGAENVMKRVHINISSSSFERIYILRRYLDIKQKKSLSCHGGKENPSGELSFTSHALFILINIILVKSGTCLQLYTSLCFCSPCCIELHFWAIYHSPVNVNWHSRETGFCVPPKV